MIAAVVALALAVPLAAVLISSDGGDGALVGVGGAGETQVV